MPEFISKTVLIAESNPMMSKVLTDTLSSLGFRVIGHTPIGSRVEALARHTRPDLILFDLSLSDGGMTGLSALTRLKKQLPEIKILLLGFHESTDQIEAKITDAGFDGLWNKFEGRARLIENLNTLFP